MKIGTCEQNYNHIKTKGLIWWRIEHMSNLTASRREVHVEDGKRLWLGPPSRPRIGPGRVISSVITADQKTEDDNLVNKTNSSCQTIVKNNYKQFHKLIKLKSRSRGDHTRNERHTTANLSKITDNSMMLKLSTISGISGSRFILLASWQLATFSWINWSSSIKVETRIRNFTATCSEQFFFLKTLFAWPWMNCIKVAQAKIEWRDNNI